MLKNYLTIALRNLWRNKGFTSINVLGLALGLACSLLIFLWITDELNVEAYHANGPYLYRVMERQYYDGKVEAQSSTPGLLADELKKQFPEIVHAAGFTGWQQYITFSAGDKITRQHGYSAGPDWFRMFSVPLLAGTPETALSSPTGVAISRQVAENYFGTPDAALGQTVRLDFAKEYQVTAVFENLPPNALRKYDFLLSWQDFLSRNPWAREWGNNAPHTVIQLRPDADPARLAAKMRYLIREFDKTLDGKNTDVQLFLQPYEDAYLYSNFENGYQDGGRIGYVRLFGVVAVFLLLIACINFMNLSTARSVRRAKEVGVRKVVGAVRSLLVVQFLGEALLLTFLALGTALGMVWLLLPVFNQLTGKEISLRMSSPVPWFSLVGLTLITGLIAGSYPALFLSSLNPARVLKGTLRFGAGATVFRQGLVVFQFILSVLLIVGTLVVYRQVHYVQTKNLGYDRENLLYIPAEGELNTRYQTFKQELLRMPGIQSVSYTRQSPVEIGNSTSGVTWPGKDPNNTMEFYQAGVGYDYLQTMKVRVNGRDFSPQFGTDSSNYIINRAAARRIGYQNPIGQPLTMWGRPGVIIGVVEDFHFHSLHVPVEPLIIRLEPDAGGQTILIRTLPGQTRQALASVETLWQRMMPAFPFTCNFADSDYQEMYKSEMMVATLANYFAALAIFISCLGLFGLAAFTAEQRTKEIGVRKVLGASVISIITLLSNDFLKLILLAIVISTPFSWYVTQKWLQNFEYKLDISWWIFALAGGLAILIALLTVSFQSIKAALANPVKSLRSE